MLTQEEKEVLKEDKLLVDLTKQEGWVKVLKPYLEAKQSKSYPDPTEFKSEKEFLYAASTASLFKKVIAELLHYMEIEVPDRIKQLEMKQRGQERNFGIG